MIDLQQFRLTWCGSLAECGVSTASDAAGARRRPRLLTVGTLLLPAHPEKEAPSGVALQASGGAFLFSAPTVPRFPGQPPRNPCPCSPPRRSGFPYRRRHNNTRVERGGAAPPPRPNPPADESAAPRCGVSAPRTTGAVASPLRAIQTPPSAATTPVPIPIAHLGSSHSCRFAKALLAGCLTCFFGCLDEL